MTEEIADVVSRDLSCGYCGAPVTGERAAHRDHIIPQSRGGGDDARNCIVSCASCNLEKHDRTPSEWKRTGLPPWIYEVERELVLRYRMKSRARKQAPLTVRRSVVIPGAQLLKHDHAVCLEYDGGACGRPADFENWSILDGSWGAKCGRCIRFYRNAENVRELDGARVVSHILWQLRAGTLDVARESSLALVARLAGITVDEYLELAVQVLHGDNVVRDALKSLAPQARLEMWIPREVV